MSLSIRPVLVLAICAAGCGESPNNNGGGGDLAACCPDLGGGGGGGGSGHDLATGGDLATSHDPDGGGMCADPTSPSGYKCDAWGVHLYLARFVSASATTLRLQLLHDPAQAEGNPSDDTWPLEHDFYQLATVDFPIDDALKSFLCVAFARTTPPNSYPIDANLENFYLSTNSLVITPQGTKRWQNVSDLCGGGSLPALLKPELLMGQFVGSPALPDVAVMIPLQPDARLLTVGAKVTGWLGRGILGADEDRELVPTIHGTVIEVQTQPCSNREAGAC
jgi:hypothetical protein